MKNFDYAIKYAHVATWQIEVLSELGKDYLEEEEYEECSTVFKLILEMNDKLDILLQNIKRENMEATANIKAAAEFIEDNSILMRNDYHDKCFRVVGE